jgi:hypothetical protein
MRVMTDLAAILRDPALVPNSGQIACPTCTESVSVISGRNAAGEPTVDVTHPQPPCAGFRAFVQRLWQRHGN